LCIFVNARAAAQIRDNTNWLIDFLKNAIYK
jgi:hypothetical protein